MIDHNPEFEVTFSDVEKKTDLICQYIRRHIPSIDIAIANHTFDEFIPDGITFILPKGAIAFDKPFPVFNYNKETNQMMIEQPSLLFLMPELIFRIDEDGTVTGMSQFNQEFVDKLNKMPL